MAYGEVLAALADPTRRRILEVLREQPRSVTTLAQTQSVSRPAVSQHLKVLEQAHLVSATQKGNARIYELRREGLDELRDYLDSFWGDVLTGFGAEVARRTLGIED